MDRSDGVGIDRALPAELVLVRSPPPASAPSVEDALSTDATLADDLARDGSVLSELPPATVGGREATSVDDEDDFLAPPVSHPRYELAEDVFSICGGAVSTRLMPSPIVEGSRLSVEAAVPFRLRRLLALVGRLSVVSIRFSSSTSDGTSGVGAGRPSTVSLRTASAKIPPRVKAVVSNQGMSSLRREKRRNGQPHTDRASHPSADDLKTHMFGHTTVSAMISLSWFSIGASSTFQLICSVLNMGTTLCQNGKGTVTQVSLASTS